VDLAKATKWLNEYTDCLLSGDNSSSKEYLSKAVGELSLLLMIIKQSNWADESLKELDILVPQIRENIDFIASSNLEKAQILLCLDLAESKCKEKFPYIEEITSKKGHVSSNIELAYILSKCGVDLPSGYWNRQLIELFNRFLNCEESSYRTILYDLTHIIFFATNFGYNEFPEKTSGLTTSSSEILLESFKTSVFEKDWDLAIELIISLVIIKSDRVSFERLLEMVNSLLQNQRADGAFVSDGDPESKPEVISYKNAYSVFHTTTIAVLLKLLSEKHLTSQITQTQQNCSSV